MNGFGIGEFCRQYQMYYNMLNGTDWTRYMGEWISRSQLWPEDFRVY